MGGRGASYAKRFSGDLWESSRKFTQEFDKLPDYLKIGGESVAQLYVYEHNLNGKPEFVSKDKFNKLVKERGENNVLYRGLEDGESLSAKEIAKMQFENEFNYVGGRIGGFANGEGIYFAQGDKEVATNYGDYVTRAMLNKKAKVIDYDKIAKMFEEKGTEKQKKEIAKMEELHRRNYATIKAHMLGYNVVRKIGTTGRRRIVVFDRSVLTMEEI